MSSHWPKFVFCISRFILLVFRFQCFDATIYTVNKVVQMVLGTKGLWYEQSMVRIVNGTKILVIRLLMESQPGGSVFVPLGATTASPYRQDVGARARVRGWN